MKGSKKISAITLLLIIQLVVMIILSIIITATISYTTRRNSMQHMQTIIDERAHIIKTYVKNSENILTYYSKASQITDLLKDPENTELQERAQAYTAAYSADIENLEGIYVSEWNTHVLAHTNPEVVGMITRKDPEPLKQLQDAMLAAGNGVYDTGIIISPASGKQIVSMYKAVYDENGNPIGLVGIGIFTNRLIETLDSLKIKGLSETSYSMVNVNDSKYVFNKNSDLVGQLAENPKIQSICASNKGRKASDSGSFEHKENGKKYISIYSYIPEHGWILMLDDTKKEIYSLTNVMRIYMGIFGLAIIGLMLLFSFINKKQEKVNQKLASTIVKSNKTKESLYTAMFKDVLTETSNRIAFSMDIDEANKQKKPYYFVMFDIDNFSGVNAKYGNDVGDWLLVKTSETLRQVFKDGKLYRTGSDEFVVAIPDKSGNTASDTINNLASEAYRKLTSTQTTPMGKINFGYKASVVRKKGEINTAVIAALKDMINNNNNAASGQIMYKEM
ncbi:sensor domain-containing diguanylate cyclase [Ruminococcus flavefaciens]|uniref:GGDEF domain-containing protein n=1 Tax=Ruminococcus flavefaciens 007c TaxID=1341157 RepID=W7UHV9_RUMFL|nr:sensor domain-containing diguanylate cyclase [Ruminococcus flavefaciens]EWM54781.1 hypothetical protein RF007C_10610 [Ruminococcus flavefaciens 007c]